MPPTAAVAAALKRFLEELPTFDKKIFERTYAEETQYVDHNAEPLILTKGGSSNAKPPNMAYHFDLGSVSQQKYTVWLENPSGDYERNKLGVKVGLERLIYTMESSKVMDTVDVSALPRA
ncbi:hypothetical protein BV20DRAFT_971047 [Pilatotrama ljubarskyi]|nr:hypothetical protein BV20DRAFT_971047 [Pilatotrama ljubarskyi]